MVSTFFRDLDEARKAEHFVCELLSSSYSNKYSFREVGSEREFYNKGDIEASAPNGEKFYIEVKKDSRIGETHNILCEEAVYYKREGIEVKGNMYSDYEVYCILSESEQKIYFIDFKELRKIYRFGRAREIEHPEQITYCYLLPLSFLEKSGGLLGVINYKDTSRAA